jgi:hypothetical protein
MAASESFLTTCRTAIALLSELTAFRAAYATFDAASADDKGQYWQAVYGPLSTGPSLAYRLRSKIREIVTVTDSTVVGADKEEAYRTLVTQYVPNVQQPPTTEQREAELEAMLLRSQLS